MSQAVQNEASPIAVFGRVRTDCVRFDCPELDPSSAEVASVWSVIKSRFDEIRRLTFDWDHRGSATVPSGTLAFAQQMLTSVMPPKAAAPAIVPLGQGGIQMVWRSTLGELEVEVVKPNQVMIFYLDNATGAEHEWEESTDFRRLSDVLWKLHRT